MGNYEFGTDDKVVATFIGLGDYFIEHYGKDIKNFYSDIERVTGFLVMSYEGKVNEFCYRNCESIVEGLLNDEFSEESKEILFCTETKHAEIIYEYIKDNTSDAEQVKLANMASEDMLFCIAMVARTEEVAKAVMSNRHYDNDGGYSKYALEKSGFYSEGFEKTSLF